MNKNSIVKIINKELSILNDFIEGFQQSEIISPMEIDLALSKVRDIYDELNLLKGGDAKPLGQVTELNTIASDTPKTIAPKSELQPEKPLIEIEKTILDEIVVEEEKVDEQADLQKAFEFINEEDEPSIEAVEQEFGKEENQAPIATVEDELVCEDHIETLEPNEIPKIEKVEDLITEPIKTESKTENDQLADIQEIEVTKEGILADKFSKNSLSVNDMLAGVKQNKDLASLLKDSPILDLKKAIKLNDRIWYINELFGKNSSTFEKTVDKVNKANNLDEALEYLFTNFNWNQERKSTINFLELVFRRFANK